MTPNADYVRHYSPDEALKVVCEAALAWADEYGPEWGDKSILLAVLDLAPNDSFEAP